MKISIIGAGAIGSLFGCSLAQDSHQVQFLTRKQETELKRQLDDNPVLEFIANNIDFIQNSDLILVCVKAMQVEDAITPWLTYIPSQTPIVFIHNGMGALDNLKQALANFDVYLATTTQAALKQSEQEVKYTGQGSTLIGHAFKTSHIVPAWMQVLPHAQWQENIELALWRKLAINCAINPLTAVLNCKNGQLCHHQDKLSIIIHELSQVFNHYKVDISEQVLTLTILDVIQATAQNYSSMHQDIMHQRFTEIDFINGYLVKRANQAKIAVPYNQELIKQIKALEANFGQ